MLFPAMMIFLAYYGGSILKNSLPSIPFLLPTAILLIIMCVRSIPLIIRGTTKTILAFFFLFAAVQNISYFQLNQVFFPVDSYMAENPNILNTTGKFIPPVDYVQIPPYLVITPTHTLCANPANVVATKYKSIIEQSTTMNDLSANFATTTIADVVVDHTADIDCIDIEPLYTFNNFMTVGITPNNWIFNIEDNNKPENSISLLRALFLLSERSIVPIPTPMLKFIYETFEIQPRALASDVAAKFDETISPFIRMYRSVTTVQFWLCIGLIFCMFGDVLLIFGSVDLFFLNGLIAFLLGHVFFLVSYIYSLLYLRMKHLPTFPVQAFGFAIFFAWFVVFLFRWVKSGKKLKFPMNYAVLVYTTIIACMVMSSWLLAMATPP
eukprot:UN01353